MLTGTLLAEPDAAIAALDEAIRVARDAGILSALSVGLPFLAGLLPIDESERSLALLDEAIEVSGLIGDRLGVSLVNGTKGALAAHRGEWRTTLEAAIESGEQQLELGNLANPGFLALGATALCGLGRFEASAVLLGKSDSMSARLSIGWGGELFAVTDAALLEALGEQQVAMLASRGAALDNTEAVAYMLEQAAPFITRS